MIVFAIAALVGAFLAIEWSSLIWASVHTLQYLQQPWRALFLPAFFIPLFALYAYQRMGDRYASVAVIALVLLNIAHTEPKGVQTYDEAFYYADSIARLGIKAAASDEYTPSTAPQNANFHTDLLKGVGSAPLVTQLSVGSSSQSFKVDASAPALMQDSLFDYSGWTVLVDDREVPSSPASDSGQITFNVPAGSHNVSIELRPTPIRRWSWYLSLATGASLSLMLLVALFMARNRTEADDKSESKATRPRSGKRPRR